MRNTKRTSIVIVAALLSMYATTASAISVLSELYLTSWSRIYVVQGTSVVRSWDMGSYGEVPIAVNGTVRTTDYRPGQFGREYSLAGTPSGPSYGHTLSSQYMYDGTTDGTYNYAVAYDSGNMFRFGTDWSNPQAIFSAGPVNRELTTTYDPTDNTLWIHQWDSNLMQHYSMAGSLLGSFNTQHSNHSSLALDHADGTLWLARHSSDGKLYQYSKTGTFLGSVVISGLPQGSAMLGGEFDLAAIPEPATLTLLGLGIVGACAARRRRRKT